MKLNNTRLELEWLHLQYACCQSSLSPTQTQPCPKVMHVQPYCLSKMTSASLPWNAKEVCALFSSLHSLLCFYDPFDWAPPYLCQLQSSDKRSFIIVWEWRTSDIQGCSRRRWSLWPVTLLWGQTASVIWCYGHTTSWFLISAVAVASNCPFRFAFLRESV